MSDEWRRSGFCSAASCLEVRFSKSAHSNPTGNSVEAAFSTDRTHAVLRDSKDHTKTIEYPIGEWEGGRAVAFTPVDRQLVPAALLAIQESGVQGSGNREQQWYTVTRDHTTLYFDQAEMDAWTRGVEDGQFETTD